MAENKLGVQTRSMANAQHIEEETSNQLEQKQVEMNTDNLGIARDNLTPNLDQQNAALNPTVKLTRTDADNIEEYIRRHSDIGLDWYVPNLSNTRVRDVIKHRLPISTGRGKILFNCPHLRKFFTTSTFEVDLTTGQVYMYLLPPEDIGVPCQQEEFDVNLLREQFQKHPDPLEHHAEELKRIPLIRKTAADIMDIGETEEKIGQYYQL